MSGKKPRVSIAVPVYNGENYLEYALETALAQTYADFEIVISDNASTDGTEEICRRFVERDSRVALLPQRSEPRRLLELPARTGTFEWRILHVAGARRRPRARISGALRGCARRGTRLGSGLHKSD